MRHLTHSLLAKVSAHKFKLNLRRWLLAAFIEANIEAKYMKWKKLSGSIIETNDLPATIAAAKKLGWKHEGKSGNSDSSTEENPKPRKKK